MHRTRQMCRKLVIARALFLSAVIAAAVSWGIAFAQAEPGLRLSVSPPRTDVTVLPGVETSGSVIVVNLSDRQIDVAASVLDFSVTGSTGVVNLAPPSAANPLSLGSHMTLTGPNTLTMAPGARWDVGFRILVPANTTGGSRFGALVFSGGSRPEPGQVNLVTSVATLVVARVRAANIGAAPQSRSQLVLSLPVKMEAGRTMSQLLDSAAGIEVKIEQGTTRLTIPLTDNQGVVWGRMIASSKQGIVSSGDSSVMTAETVRVEGVPWLVDLTGDASGVQKAEVLLAFDLLGVPSGSAVHVQVTGTADAGMQSAVKSVAEQAGAGAVNIAYVVNIEKAVLRREVANATITFRVARQWAEANDPNKVSIVRYADDGSAELLFTRFKGFEGDNAVFEAFSPQGFSTFALAAFEKPPTVVVIKAGTLPIPITDVPPSGRGVFTMNLTPDVKMSASVTATDDRGTALTAAPGQSLRMRTEIVAPVLDDVKVKVTPAVLSGRLEWRKVPRFALAGGNDLVISFVNTSATDYEVATGLIRAVGMNGRSREDILLPNFNAFPTGSRDLTVEWITPSRAFGRYTLSAVSTFGDPPQSVFSEPVSVWVIPWKWALTILLVIGGLGLGLWLLVKTVRESVEKEIRRRSAAPGGTPPGGPANG